MFFLHPAIARTQGLSALAPEAADDIEIRPAAAGERRELLLRSLRAQQLRPA